MGDPRRGVIRGRCVQLGRAKGGALQRQRRSTVGGAKAAACAVEYLERLAVAPLDLKHPSERERDRHLRGRVRRGAEGSFKASRRVRVSGVGLREPELEEQVGAKPLGGEVRSAPAGDRRRPSLERRWRPPAGRPPAVTRPSSRRPAGRSPAGGPRPDREMPRRRRGVAPRPHARRPGRRGGRSASTAARTIGCTKRTGRPSSRIPAAASSSAAAAALPRSRSASPAVSRRPASPSTAAARASPCAGLERRATLSKTDCETAGGARAATREDAAVPLAR